MSFDLIRTAFKERLESFEVLENVEDRLRFDANGFQNAAFKALFIDSSKDVQAWWFTSPTYGQQPCEDGDKVEKRIHAVEIHGIRGLVDKDATEHQLRDMAEYVGDRLTWGDRTLGGLIIAYSSPQLTRISPIKFYGGPLCHEAVLSLNVEELVYAPEE